MADKRKSDSQTIHQKTTHTELVPKAENSRLKRAEKLSNGSVERFTRVDPTTNARQMFQHDPQTNSEMYFYSYDSRDDPSFKDKYNEKDGKGCVVQRRAAFYTSSTPQNQHYRSNHGTRVQEISHEDGAALDDGNKSNAKRAAAQPIVEEPDDDHSSRHQVSNRNDNSLTLPTGRNDPFESMQRRMETHMAQMESAFGDFGMLGRGRSFFDDAFFHGFTMNDDWPFDGGFFGSRNRAGLGRQSGL
ncbi:unnamed protein product [Phytomonas sp. EM1]|nr:unnamed protein product [Phytomonas sp. EM1]|eukprot:CCW60233.1 unnamed protein product [Phytomonas sp. isolate EM1]